MTISIIMPYRNARKTLPETLRSVQSQTERDWELLAIDDHATDGSAALVRQAAAADPRIRPLINIGRPGPADARNTGLSAARGALVAFIDSDDLWLPEKLRRQRGFLETRDLDFTFTAFEIIDRHGHATGLDSAPEALTYRSLLGHNRVKTSTVMMRREPFADIRFPDTYHEDYGYFLRVLERVPAIHGLDEPLTRYRVHPDSLTGDKLRSALGTWRFYREHLGLSLPRSLRHFSTYALAGLRRYVWKPGRPDMPIGDVNRGS